ncbi:putative 2-C-methyl-D-erythritol 2,4-cyclodiphosphate synthase, chloroplastic [Iris pallida]|uniref:2-C-methyl-D-erythritol 2,4-cyclodiphosphate synthase n=1 Tax=Iris pallida TaxID=29817 RepID=A0AAX6EUH8_IRIPA|nr:putative 2-C-methyl-D-erythritol 2,4-cyclodiphosphate synthase, chloroplastic [Iris pallida]
MASSLFLPSPPLPTTNIRPRNPLFSSSFSFRSRSVRPFLQLRASAALDSPTLASANPSAPPRNPTPSLPFRVGHGFDLHRLEPNLPLIVGGVHIPHTRGCDAHSDGDVLFHCVVDAILGALGLPDIGQIFPDSDPKWRGAASSVFMKEAVRLMHEAGYELGNLDATLILQKPKLSPHKEAIRANLCDLLGADPSVVNLKAKTHEKVDSLGENRSIAAHTVVLLMRK